MFKGSLYLIDVLGRSNLDRPIEVIIGRWNRGELALLKSRAMDPDVDEVGERWQRLQKMTGGPRQPSGEGRSTPLRLDQR